MTFYQQVIGWGAGARGTSPGSVNYGPSPTAGNLLVAIVMAGFGTAGAFNTAQNTGTSGWTRRFQVGNDAANTASTIGLAVWTKIAGASEPAPSFTYNASWTGQTIVYEIFNAASEIPEISGTLSGGTTAASKTSLSVATTAAPTDPNEVIISAYATWMTTAGTCTYSKSSNMTGIGQSDTFFSQSQHFVSSHLTPTTNGTGVSTAGVFTDTSSCTFPSNIVYCGVIMGWKGGSTTPPAGLINPVAYPYSVSRSSGQGTLGVQVSNVGSLLAVAHKTASSTINMSGVSDTAGITSGWTKVAGPYTDTNGTPHTQDIWIGVSTGTGATTLNFTYSATIGSTSCDTTFAEFYNGYPSTFARDGTQQSSKNNTTASTAISWNALTASLANEIFIGRARVPAGAPYKVFVPAGFDGIMDSNANPFMYGSGMAAGLMGTAPNMTCFSSVTSHTLGVLIQQTIQLSGSGASAATASGTLSTLGALVGSAPSSSSGSGTITWNTVIAGSAPSASAGNGTITRTAIIAGSGSSSSSATGNFSPLVVTGSGASSSSAAGTVTRTALISGLTLNATPASGSIVQTMVISASAPSASSANGTMGLNGVIAGSAPCASAANGTVTRTALISGSSITSSAANGAVGQIGVVAGSSASASSATGTLGTISQMVGASATTSQGSGTLTIVSGAQTYPVAGTSLPVSSASGTLSLNGALAGSASSASSAAGTVALRGAVSGSATAQTSASGTITRTAVIAGSAASSSAGSGAVAIQTGAVTWPLAGSSVAASLAAGTMGLTGVLAGSSLAASTGSGTVVLAGRLSGAATARSAASGAVSAVLVLAGSGLAASGASGHVTVLGILSGLAVAASSADGSVTAFVAGALPDKITAIVFVVSGPRVTIGVSSISANVEVGRTPASVETDAMTGRVTIDKLHAEVT